MNGSKSLIAMVVLTALVTTACLDDSITGSRTLAVELTMSASAVSTGETVTAIVTASGTGLQGLIIDWGDGVVDSLPLSGVVVTAESAFDYDYSTGGTYSVVATAEDQSGKSSDEATVEVTEPSTF